MLTIVTTANAASLKLQESSILAEHHAQVINPKGVDHHAIPGGYSKHFCPLHLGMRSAKENTTVKHCMAYFTYTEKGQQGQLQWWASVPYGQWVSPSGQMQDISLTHRLLVPQ